MTSSPLFLILLSVLTSSIAQVALKIAAPRAILDGPLWPSLWRLMTNGWLILGVVLYFAAFIMWIPGLRRVDLSFAYPFIALGVILVTLFSWAFLRESIGPVRLAGISLIVVGLLVVSRS